MALDREDYNTLGILSQLGGLAAAPFTGGASLAAGAGLASIFGALSSVETQDEVASQLRDAAAEQDQNAKAELEFRQSIINKLANEWTQPTFDTTKFTPQEIKYIGDYMPQVVQFVQEQRPELITGLKAEHEKNLQTQALSQLSQEAIGKPVEVQDMIKQKVELAQIQANQAEKVRRASLLQDLANRGMTGTGQEALLLSSGQQQSDAVTRQAALQAGIVGAQEQQAAQERENARKLNAIQALGSLSTSARQQQLGIEEQNANAINAFNQRAATRLQQHLQNQADTQNRAAMQNQQLKQNVSTQNAQEANQAQQYNINRADRLSEILANAKNRQLEAITGAMGGYSDIKSKLGAAEYNRLVEAAKRGDTSILNQVLLRAPELTKSATDLYNSVKNQPKQAPTIKPTSQPQPTEDNYFKSLYKPEDEIENI